MPGKKDPRIDKLIKDAPAFAKPILNHIRKTVHAVCPAAEETVKWDAPFFMYRGKILCGMGTFKSHCKFFLWNWKRILKAEGAGAKAEMNKIRHVAVVADLPKAATLKSFLRQGMKLNEAGIAPVKRPAQRKPPVKTPPDLARALRGTPKAQAVFETFSPSVKRHYVEWITGAKTEATRERRLEKAVDCIAAGKKQHWK